MIHECGAALSVAYRPFVPTGTEPVLCFENDRILLAGDAAEIRFPTASEIEGDKRYLFTLGNVPYFEGTAAAFGGYRYEAPFFLRSALPRERAFAGVTGLHLARWYRDRRFCGRCGRPMRHSKTERAMTCGCGNVVYPQICPAVIVAITTPDRRRICLTRYNRPNARWSLVAGYTEIGETPEETVRREALEETGLRVKNVRYYRSQPWGLSGSLLLGFFCETENPDDLRPDGEELREACWFTPEEIDFTDDGFSLTRHMIEVFRTGS